jgi:hypothetical protein
LDEQVDYTKPLGRNVEEDLSVLKDPLGKNLGRTPEREDIPAAVEQGILYLAVAKQSESYFWAYTAYLLLVGASRKAV